MKIKLIEKKAICLVMAICAVLCLCIGFISVSMRANAETASSSSEKVQASVDFTTMGISAAKQMGFETENLATDANGHSLYGAVPGAQWDGLVSGGNASVTYTLDAGLGYTLSGGTLSLDVLSGHQGGVYWWRSDGKLGANLTVSVSTDTYDWTQIFDLQDCNPGVKNQDCIPGNDGIPTGQHYVNSDNPIALSQGNGQRKLYIKIDIIHLTAAETGVPGWENGIPLNRLGLCLYKIDIAADKVQDTSGAYIHANADFTKMSIAAVEQDTRFTIENLATDENGNSLYGAVPGAQWGGSVSGGNASVTYTLNPEVGKKISDSYVSFEVGTGHAGGVYWYRSDGKLGANFTVSVSVNNSDWTKVFDLDESTQHLISKEADATKNTYTSDGISLKEYLQGGKQLYIRFDVMHFTPDEAFKGWTSIPVGQVGLLLFNINIVSEVEICSNHQYEAVDEVPATVYAEGVKAHYICGICGGTYLLNESGEYTAVNAEDLRIERLTGFLGANIALNNNLDCKYYAYVGGTPTSVQAEFTMDGKTTLVEGVKNGDQYVFVFKKLGPQNVGKEITARLLVDGEEKAVETYSAHEYLYEVFKQSDEANKKLIADIFEYCAAAQAYLGDTDMPVNTLHPDVAACKTDFVAPETTGRDFVENATVEGFTFTAANLKISSEVQMLFKFNAGDDGYKLIVNGKDVTDKVATHADGSLVYYTDGVSVVDFDTVFTTELYSGETLVQTVKYSVNSYVYSKCDSTNTLLANMVQCLYNYGLSAEKIA